ncbi:sensor histidine kinase [Gorillibacterium massiliense]|uniref:sensor histidine kinase n=1 Tax=Gorillibacterium massiliense TaxID=1280390 RepID=UPI0004BB6542|nr:histidine kinase [Gorillibacterium massiliense]
MDWNHSVRVRIMLGLVLVIAPLVILLFYNNFYAIDVVQKQTSQNYAALLQQNTENVDNMLSETSTFLYRFVDDTDFTTLYAYGTDSADYYMTKIRVQIKLSSGTGYYKIINSVFAYSRAYDDLTMYSKGNYASQYDRIRGNLSQFFDSPEYQWNLIRTDNGYSIYRIAYIFSDFISGVWIDLDSLVAPLRDWNLGEGTDFFLVDSKNNPLTTPANGQFHSEDLTADLTKMEKAGKSYGMFSDPSTSKRYLMVKASLMNTPISYVMTIPETTIVKKLPYFQKALIYIPILVGVVLIAMLLFLQRELIRPLSGLMRGMNNIGKGKLNIRLNIANKGEFAYINRAFNDMATQIANLKINVYEEQLRVQQAEYRHLQVQINPHFFMNSLNILYNLAILKDFRSVQKMALHLADFFRFTTHSNRSTVTLGEELKHIENYLEIQVLRYPDNLSYSIELPEKLDKLPVPPLTVQPFVENTIIHGFQKRNEIFAIEIVVREDETDPTSPVVITVRDSGIGFSAEALEAFKIADWREAQSDHVGIWNVMRRLIFLYGNHASVTFRNLDGQGAEVELRLPLHEDILIREEYAHVQSFDR